MNFRSIFLIPLISSLVACGGVDEEPPGDVDMSTFTGCLQDTWTRASAPASGANVELTYEFLENGTFIQRSHVDNISTYEYLNGIENTDYDMEVLPGISLDIIMLLQILGPFYVEGYFHTQGTWTADNETGVVTMNLPATRAFGHSIWSANGAKNDFNRSYPNVESMELKSSDQYAYCTDDQLVVGTFRKDDDSDIAGLWNNLKDDFYVAEDYAGATYRLRVDTGELYSKSSYRMYLESDGYKLGSCLENGTGHRLPGLEPKYFVLTPEGELVDTGVVVPEQPENPGFSYREILSDEYLYIYNEGTLVRRDIYTGNETTLNAPGLVGSLYAVEKIAGGLLLIAQETDTETSDSFISAARIYDDSDEVSLTRLFPYVFVTVNRFGDLLMLKSSEAENSRIWTYDFVAGVTAQVAIPDDLIAGDFLSHFRRGDRALLLEEKVTGATWLWDYNFSSGEFEEVTSIPEGVYGQIYPTDSGVDLVRALYRQSDRDASITFSHLSAENDFALTYAESFPDYVRFQQRRDNMSQYFFSTQNRDNPNQEELYLVDTVMGTAKALSPEPHEVGVPEYFDDGNRILYRNEYPSSSYQNEMIAIRLEGNELAETQRFPFFAMYQYDAAALDGVTAFHLQSYVDGEAVSYFYVADGPDSSFNLISTDYHFGEDNAAFGDDFIVSDYHMIAAGRTEYSGRELLMYNPETKGVDFMDVLPIPDASSALTYVGSLKSGTVLSGWDEDNGCAGPHGDLHFEEGNLWYENGIRSFSGTQWFVRD